jgi:hypothetical protein
MDLTPVLEQEDQEGVLFRTFTTARRRVFASKKGFLTITRERLHFDPELSMPISPLFGRFALNETITAISAPVFGLRQELARVGWFMTVDLSAVQGVVVQGREVSVFVGGMETRFVLDRADQERFCALLNRDGHTQGSRSRRRAGRRGQKPGRRNSSRAAQRK